MVDVSRWLAEQGLEHHTEAFTENGIAGDILRELTDADLKELGLNLGDRKRLLKAIAALDAGPTQDRTERAEQTTMTAAPREAERRQLTVLFCDLVSSTALAAQARSRGHGRRSSERIITPAPKRSSAGAATSPSTWATACSPISAGRRRTRMTPSARSGRGWSCLTTSGSSTPRRETPWRPGSASRPVWSWSAS